METDGCKGRSGFVCTRPVSVVVSCVVGLDTCLKAGSGQLGAKGGHTAEGTGSPWRADRVECAHGCVFGRTGRADALRRCGGCRSPARW